VCDILQSLKKSKIAASARASALASIGVRTPPLSASSAWWSCSMAASCVEDHRSLAIESGAYLRAARCKPEEQVLRVALVVLRAIDQLHNVVDLVIGRPCSTVHVLSRSSGGSCSSKRVSAERSVWTSLNWWRGSGSNTGFPSGATSAKLPGSSPCELHRSTWKASVSCRGPTHHLVRKVSQLFGMMLSPPARGSPA
jgi:hypothetical protein